MMYKNKPKRYLIRLLILIGLILLSSCQELSIQVEMPVENDQILETPLVMPQVSMPTKETALANTLPPIATNTPPILTPTQPAFDPPAALLGWEYLPQNVHFSGGHLKNFNVSYLNSPGNLLGTAYVREYISHPHDLYLTEVLIHSPFPISPEMLRAGFYGNDVYPVEESRQIGSFTLAGQRQDEFNTLAYRFAKGNFMVVLALQGSHPFATPENLEAFAQAIEVKLPQGFEEKPAFPAMQQTEDKQLYQKYFYDFVLTDCTAEHLVTDTFIHADQGFCFRADVKEVLVDLQIGIYSPRYDQLLYVKQFESFSKLGEWQDFILRPVWDFGWQHLTPGEYEVRIWVNDMLAAVRSFQFQPEDDL